MSRIKRALYAICLFAQVGPVAGVPTAAAIRYAWFDGWPGCNVYNSVQLPLVPFNQTLG